MLHGGTDSPPATKITMKFDAGSTIGHDMVITVDDIVAGRVHLHDWPMHAVAGVA